MLPLFHVGGLNIQTTPALQLGATVTLHPRFTPDATLEALWPNDKPTLTVLVPATMQAVIEHPRWAETDIDLPARAHHRLDAGAAGPRRCLHGARRSGAAGLRLDRDLPGRGLYARGRRPARGLDRPARPRVRGARRGRRGQRSRARRSGRSRGARAERVLRILGQCGSDRRDLARRLVSFGRHRHARRRRAFLHPRPQEEHDHLGRREHLSGRGRARADRASRRGRRRRDRPRRSEMAGGAGRLCGAARRMRRCDARALEAHLLVAARALQGAARIRVRGCAAAQRDGQGAAFRAARAGSR